MPKTKICEICKRPKTNMICIDCVERDMRDWENKIFQKGKLEQKKEELEFLDDCFRVYRGEKYIQSDSISKLIERIKQLQKEIGGIK